MNKEQCKEDQLRMCYAASGKATQNAMRDFINKRHKERYAMVERLRAAGELESRWHEVEAYDAETDKQEAIYDELLAHN